MHVFIFTTNTTNTADLANLFTSKKILYMVSADIMKLNSNYDILIVPGGNAGRYQKLLGAEGVAVIRDFVANGGDYLGLCAGVYLGLMDDTTSTKNIGIRLLPVRYSLYGRSANIRANVKLYDARTKTSFETIYHNGPVFGLDQMSSSVTALATITDTDCQNQTFHDFLVDKVTIVTGTFNKGRVTLCGPHIETNMKSYMFSLMS